MDAQDNLAYFKGWNDACQDVSKFLKKTAKSLPSDVDFLADCLINIADGVDEKGKNALSIAQSIINEKKTK